MARRLCLFIGGGLLIMNLIGPHFVIQIPLFFVGALLVGFALTNQPEQ